MKPNIPQALQPEGAKREFRQSGIVCPGKLCEGLQGVLPNGSRVLSTLVATDCTLDAEISIEESEEFSVHRGGVYAKKATEACKIWAARRRIDPNFGVQFQIKTHTPVGKGRASSSQDIWISVLELARYLNEPTTFREIYSVACEVERSDFLPRPNRIILADPTRGEYEDIGPMPSMLAVLWDDAADETVLTSEVAHLDDARSRSSREYSALVDMLRLGNRKEIMDVSTASARFNQNLLPKSTFGFASWLADRVGGGVTVAHTGTFCGVIFPPEIELLVDAVAQAEAEGLHPQTHTIG